LCPDPNGEPDIVGERPVGDLGVAEPRLHKKKIELLWFLVCK